MAGRGRGGKTGSLTQEQLQALGCIGKDMPQVQTAPPPTFPPLMSKPVKLETTAAQSYQILWKEDFLNHMRDSPYFLTPKVAAIDSNLQRYSDQWTNAVQIAKAKTKLDFVWQMMPAELHLTQKKRRANASGNDKERTKKAKNIEDRLKVLEEKERNENDTDVPAKATTDSEQEEEEEEEAPADEEMDDENDYGNSYFDNGEAYNEEDDNLDDGPVY